MQKILLAGLLILLLAVPAPAAEKEVAGVFFPLPEGWSVVEENTSGTTSTLLLRQADRRTAIAVMVAADAGLAPAQIAAELASVTGATADPVEREGSTASPSRRTVRRASVSWRSPTDVSSWSACWASCPRPRPCWRACAARLIPASCCAEPALS